MCGYQSRKYYENKIYTPYNTRHILRYDGCCSEKPLTHDVYDGWKSISSTSLSKDGNWLGYRIAPQEGDDLLEIQNLETKEILQVERVSRYVFSTNSDFIIAEVKPEYQKVRELKIAKTSAKDMPKDSLYVIELASGNMHKVARVKTFNCPENLKSGWRGCMKLHLR